MSRRIAVSPSLLSLHLSGNPGLNKLVMSRIQGKLKATYELPLAKQTFKPLIKIYDNRHGGKTAEKKDKVANMRENYLDDVESRSDSLDSESLNNYSQKHKIAPQKIQD